MHHEYYVHVYKKCNHWWYRLALASASASASDDADLNQHVMMIDEKNDLNYQHHGRMNHHTHHTHENYTKRQQQHVVHVYVCLYPPVVVET